MSLTNDGSPKGRYGQNGPFSAGYSASFRPDPKVLIDRSNGDDYGLTPVDETVIEGDFWGLCNYHVRLGGFRRLRAGTDVADTGRFDLANPVISSAAPEMVSRSIKASRPGATSCQPRFSQASQRVFT